jgi:Uma2 family endonuclease
MAGSSQEGTIGAGKLTYEDYVTLPDDGKRHEILDGDLVMTPPPLIRHQRVSRNLVRALDAHVREQGLGEILYAPVGVVLAPHTIVEPDIVFVSTARAAIIERHAVVGAPDLLVEILSRATAARDRGAKAKLYARFDVEHYWIVDPVKNTLEAFARVGGAYGPVTKYAGSTVVRVPPFESLSLDLRTVWE